MEIEFCKNNWVFQVNWYNFCGYFKHELVAYTFETLVYTNCFFYWKVIDLQLNSYIIETFRGYFNAPPTNHKIHLLCYAQMKAHCSKTAQSKFEVLTLKGYLVILVSFNFWGRLVNCLPVFCLSSEWPCMWNITILRYNFYIISTPTGRLFVKIVHLLTYRIMTSAFRIQGLRQKCQSWFLNFSTKNQKTIAFFLTSRFHWDFYRGS